MAYAVEDIERAALMWAEEVGAGPFFLSHHRPLHALDGDGEPAVFLHSSAYGQWGEVQLELVQVHAGTSPSFAAAVVRPPAVHHVAYYVHDLAVEQQRLAVRGWPPVMTARTAEGLTFGFSDARTDLGHLVELYEPHARLHALYTRVAQASEGWDGRDPFRSLT